MRTNAYSSPEAPLFDYSGIDKWENARIRRTLITGSQVAFDAKHNFGVTIDSELQSVATFADNWLVSMLVTIRENVPPFGDPQLQQGREAARHIAIAHEKCHGNVQ